MAIGDSVLVDHRFWLKIVLGSLAVGAVVGVMAVLTGGAEVFTKAFSTVCIVAGASGLMMAAGVLIERPTARACGIVLAVLIIALFVVSLAIIWLPHGLYGYWGLFGELFWLTMGALLLVGMPAILVARLLHTKHSRLAGRIGMYVAGATLGMLLVGTWWPDTQGYGYGSFDGEKFWASGTALGLLGLLAVGSLIGLNRPSLRPWRWAGVAASVIAIAVAEYAIWWDIHSDSGIFTTITSIAIVSCHANVLFSLSIPVKFRWLVRATIYTGIITAVIVDVLVVFDLYDYYYDTFLMRLFTAGMLLTACGTVALLFLAFFNRTRQRALPRGEFKTMDVVCPMCSNRQTLTAGQTTACEGCGLWMQVNLAEPRCTSCDYLLFHVKGPNCPECGQPIDITPAFGQAITSTRSAT